MISQTLRRKLARSVRSSWTVLKQRTGLAWRRLSLDGVRIDLSPETTRSFVSEIAMDQIGRLYSMIDPICLRVVVFQNETDEPAEAAINIPSLSRAMHVASLLLWMDHFESVSRGTGRGSGCCRRETRRRVVSHLSPR